MKLTFGKYEIAIFFLCTSVFLCTYYVRCGIVGNALAGINIFALLSVLYIIYNALTKKQWFYFRCTNYVIILYFSISVLYFISQLANNMSLKSIVLRYLSTIIPTLLLYVEITPKIRRRCINIGFLIVDMAVGIMFAMLLLDIAFDKEVIRMFANWSHNDSLIAYSNSTSRFASIMGHYIPTAEAYTIYFILHSLKRAKQPIKEPIYKYGICCMISIFGVCMTGSKAYIVTVLLLLIVFNVKKIRNIIIAVGTVLFLNFSGAFDLVLQRFSEGSLTSGRTEKLLYLIERYNLFPTIIGNGSGSSYQFNLVIDWASAAFEYVFVMFAYEYGLFFSVLLYIFVFFTPIFDLLKNREYIGAVSVSLLAISVNLFNGIGLGLDYMYLYVVATFFIMNYCKE